jgi:hypothetical protein
VFRLHICSACSAAAALAIVSASIAVELVTHWRKKVVAHRFRLLLHGRLQSFHHFPKVTIQLSELTMDFTMGFTLMSSIKMVFKNEQGTS